jgi:ESCRT-II complex subunit VPS22
MPFYYILFCFSSLASKGYWGELLGVSDFYYELGIQIIDVCLSTRALNGGLMELSEVKRRVEKMRGVRNPSSSFSTTTSTSRWANAISAASNSHSNNNSNKETSMEITEDDVLRSVKTLAPLGSGFQVLQIGDKKMISSVPRELNRDQSVILGLVQVNEKRRHWEKNPEEERGLPRQLEPLLYSNTLLFLFFFLVENKRAC